jgi:hypothetical protein
VEALWPCGMRWLGVLAEYAPAANEEFGKHLLGDFVRDEPANLICRSTSVDTLHSTAPAGTPHVA